MRKKHVHPPSLSPFEHTRQLLASPFQWLVDARTRTGDIARLGIGHQSVLLSSHPEHADHVFRRHARRYARAGRFWDALPDIFGRGLLMTADETWLRHRRLLQRFFRRDHLLSISEPLLATIEDAVARHLGRVCAEQSPHFRRHLRTAREDQGGPEKQRVARAGARTLGAAV